MTVVGFTGSQEGTTVAQRRWLLRRLRELGAVELHHGDCIGADQAAHTAARLTGVRTVVHPPDNDSKRAFCFADKVLPEKPYLARNRDIVDACDVLLATPARPEYLRSGTWSTVRYARKVGRTVEVCLPEGVK